jgi:hypothetical protein
MVLAIILTISLALWFLPNWLFPVAPPRSPKQLRAEMFRLAQVIAQRRNPSHVITPFQTDEGRNGLTQWLDADGRPLKRAVSARTSRLKHGKR